MASQEYLDLLTTIEDLGYTEYKASGIIRYLDVAFNDFAYKYRNKEETEGLAIEMAWYAYAFIERTTGKSMSDIIEGAKELHIRKNAGYSGNNSDPWTNFRACKMFNVNPIDGILTRLTDKYMRMMFVYSDSTLEQVGEKLEDTVLDFAAYLIIYVVMSREERDI
jgi:hypothetical protein